MKLKKKINSIKDSRPNHCNKKNDDQIWYKHQISRDEI